MSTHTFSPQTIDIPGLSHRNFAIVYSEWNTEITEALLQGAKKAFAEYGVKEEQLFISQVPGAYEVPFMTHHLLKNKHISGAIALGCVIKGETHHDEYINHAVAQKLMDLSIQFDIPIMYGMVTTLTLEQAKARSGGEHGNKGYDAVISLLRVLNELHNLMSK